MGWYHALAADGDTPTTVYHLCPKSDYNEKTSVYYPKAYDTDKFTRAMHIPQRLMETANCFYKESDEKEWVCLEINTIGLRVDGIEIVMEQSSTDPDLKCPHIFGGIPSHTIKKVYKVVREADGTFVFIQGLTDTCSGSGSH